MHPRFPAFDGDTRINIKTVVLQKGVDAIRRILDAKLPDRRQMLAEAE